MAHLLVNGQPTPLDSGHKTWGDVLQAVETAADARGDAVTAVRFEGVDLPTFRAPLRRSTPVDRLARVEVDTVPRVRLLRATLGTAGLSLPALAAGACRAATLFRRGHRDEGHQQLTTLLATVRTLLELTLAAAAASGTDLSTLSCGDESAADVLGSLGVVMDTLAQSQRVGDWPALSDGLEFELAPGLLRWGIVFDAMHDRCAA